MRASSVQDWRQHNASLYDNRGWVKGPYIFSDLGTVGETLVPRQGVSFDVRGVIQLESGDLPTDDTFNTKYGNSYPVEVTGIKVERSSPAVHFLISCQWGRAGAGEEVARLVMRLANGKSHEMVVRSGEDVGDWWPGPDVRVPPDKVGWHGWLGVERDREVIISELVWQNPYPGIEIESFDFKSTLGAAAPFLIGVTLE